MSDDRYRDGHAPVPPTNRELSDTEKRAEFIENITRKQLAAIDGLGKCEVFPLDVKLQAVSLERDQLRADLAQALGSLAAVKADAEKTARYLHSTLVAERDELRAKVAAAVQYMKEWKDLSTANSHLADKYAARLAIAVKALASIHEDGPRFLFAVPLDPTKFINEMARVKDLARRALDEIGEK